MRLTDRFTNTEKRGLMIMILIMAVVIIAVILQTYGMQRPVIIVRDTVTCFIEHSADSISRANTKGDKIKKRKSSPTSKKRIVPSRSPLDEPVPISK